MQWYKIEAEIQLGSQEPEITTDSQIEAARETLQKLLEIREAEEHARGNLTELANDRLIIMSLVNGEVLTKTLRIIPI